MVPNTRPISWVKAALKEFEKFPDHAQDLCLLALTIAAEGGKSDLVKPWHGLGPGVLEIALPYRGDAYRVVYALQIGEEIWVVHAFKTSVT
jgi:phage-related protein